MNKRSMLEARVVSVRSGIVLFRIALLFAAPIASAAAPLFTDAGSGEDVSVPDAIGGAAATHILIRLAPGLEPAAMPNGQITVDNGGAIDELNRSWGVATVEPVLSAAADNALLAADLGLNRTYRFLVKQDVDTQDMAAAYTAAAGIELVELDGVGGLADTIPNDTRFRSLWGMHNTGQSILGSRGAAGADIDAPAAWDLHTGSGDVLIAIIDTGVMATHAELAGKVISGWNTYDNNGDTNDTHGHGTHVAGTAAAIGNNGVGVAGVNWHARILAMRCLSPTGSGTESQCAAAIVWAADHGADVISMSLQYYTGTQTFRDAVDYAHGNGVLVIAASGNNRGNSVAYPARFENCMAVGATDKFDAWATFSNYGPQLDVTAPGRDVYSLLNNGGYAWKSGTSMATPHVSGLASLIMSYNSCLTNADVRRILTATADDLGPVGFDEKFGWGRINAFSALSAASPAGDLNCDCEIDLLDVEPFIDALIDPAGYAAKYPDCDIANADINHDGSVDLSDVEGFVELLLR